MKEWCMRIIFVAFLAIATVILCLFMTGCAQRYESGHDQLFELSERHIIYRSDCSGIDEQFAGEAADKRTGD